MSFSFRASCHQSGVIADHSQTLSMDGDKVVACANMSALLAHERKLRAAATANLLSLEKMLHRTRREAEDATQPTSISLHRLFTQHEREISKEKRTSQNLKVSLVPAAPSASLIVRCSAQARLDETERELKEAVARLNNQFGSSGSARARLLHLRAEVGLLREQWAAVSSQLRTEANSTAAWLEHSMAEAIEQACTTSASRAEEASDCDTFGAREISRLQSELQHQRARAAEEKRMLETLNDRLASRAEELELEALRASSHRRGDEIKDVSLLLTELHALAAAGADFMSCAA
ncbi:MAG: hypothetical protein SGPRY_000617 [Prymnesium sp.]